MGWKTAMRIKIAISKLPVVLVTAHELRTDGYKVKASRFFAEKDNLQILYRRTYAK